MRQFFYLVVENYDESTYPQKIFLQEYEAIQWGRRLATKLLKDGYGCREVALFRQQITRSGELEYIKTLLPYKDNKEADFDIDKQRV